MPSCRTPSQPTSPALQADSLLSEPKGKQRSGELGGGGTGKDKRQEEKEMTENEMVGWHH